MTLTPQGHNVARTRIKVIVSQDREIHDLIYCSMNGSDTIRIIQKILW